VAIVHTEVRDFFTRIYIVKIMVPIMKDMLRYNNFYFFLLHAYELKHALFIRGLYVL
jgi:hypothetical protein